MGFLTTLANDLSRDLRTERDHRRVRPLHSMGFLTYRCTSRCRTCTIWRRESSHGSGRELSGEEWLRVLERLHVAGVGDFEIFGGDALLRNDAVFDIIRYCHDHGMKSYFPTNSISCDRDTVRMLIEAGLGTVYLSLDDLGDDNDGIRGVHDTFRRVTDALAAFILERGNRREPAIVVCTTLSRLNYRNFPRLVEFLDRYPIDAIYPRPLGEFSPENIRASRIDGLEPEPYFMSSDGESHLLDPEQFRELDTLLKRYRNRAGRTFVHLLAHYLSTSATYTRGIFPVHPCHVATLLVTITPNGDVTPCPFFPSYVIGNLTRQELGEFWGNAAHRKFIDLQQADKIPICRNCNMRLYYPTFFENIGYYLRRSVDKIHGALSGSGC